MSNLSNRLHAWALNEEMINTHFTEHGCDCVSASELLVQQDAEIERLRGLLQWWLDAGPDADWDEHERRVREALGE